MRDVDPGGPALALVSPVVLAFLPQHELSGHAVRPLDLESFANGHADAFVRAWSVEGA